MNINKCNKLTCTILNEENYAVHIRALKQALNHGLIQFNPEAWLKPYIGMNTELTKEGKMISKRISLN